MLSRLFPSIVEFHHEMYEPLTVRNPVKMYTWKKYASGKVEVAEICGE